MSDAIQRIREALAWSARAFGDHSDDIRALLDRLDAAVREIERLRHDIERHIAIASEHATECERLRAELAKANALLLTYGWHRDECAFLEVCDDCDCGFEAILRKALTINKAARKGEGEE